MTVTIASSRIIAVVGLGQTGLSVARYLARLGQSFVLLDTREQPPLLDVFLSEFPDVQPECGPLNAATLLAAEQIVVSPGISLADPALQQAIAAGIEVVGDVELFAREAEAPIIAITGSNGKTTVTQMVGEMLNAAGLKVLVGGNIGIPVLDLLVRPKPQFYVLELSSFQLETTLRLNAASAVVLNVTHDHMDRYDSFSQYHAAKMRIFFGAETMVVNRDAILSQGPLAEGMSSVRFGLGQPDLKDFGVINRAGEQWLAHGIKPLVAVSELNVLGAHNISNALAAMALVSSVGGLNQAALTALTLFTGVRHRCERVAETNGVVFINDSKATNVGATLAAIAGLSAQFAEAKIYLILGGQGKGADFSTIVAGLNAQVATIYVFGEDAAEIITAIAQAKTTVAVDSLAEAVAKAFAEAKSGDIVLLSPACASFDMFTGFEARGDAFVECVEALAS